MSKVVVITIHNILLSSSTLTFKSFEVQTLSLFLSWVLFLSRFCVSLCLLLLCTCVKFVI